MLGLAVTKRSITVVEVAPANGGGQGRRAAEFVLGEGMSPDEPLALGRALKRFLQEKGFSASRCVIGLEANALTARARMLPAGAGDSVPEILSLMIEREFAADRQTLLFDYAPGPEAAEERSALLVAAPRQAVDRLRAMAKAAGLKVAAVTSSTIALAGADEDAPAKDHLVVHLFGGGAELALRRGGALRLMRRLPVSVTTGPVTAEPSTNGWLGDLADELHRVVALLPAAGDAEAPELVIWNDVGLDEEACGVLSERLRLPVRFCGRIEGLIPDGAAAESAGGQFSAAAAMALCGLQGRPLPIDLCHSRLSPKAKLGIRRKMMWGGVAAAVVIGALTFALLDWRQDSIEAASLDAQLEAMNDDLIEARGIVDKVTAARPWYDRRPKHLACMTAVTEAFPWGSSIWVTSLDIGDDRQVRLSGRATSKSVVVDVLRDLEARAELADVTLDRADEAERGARVVVFGTSFTFIDLDGTWSSPDVKN